MGTQENEIYEQVQDTVEVNGEGTHNAWQVLWSFK